MGRVHIKIDLASYVKSNDQYTGLEALRLLEQLKEKDVSIELINYELFHIPSMGWVTCNQMDILYALGGEIKADIHIKLDLVKLVQNTGYSIEPLIEELAKSKLNIELVNTVLSRDDPEGIESTNFVNLFLQSFINHE
ncbi:hypothetical protein [Entomomonas asaccharolytica]|uniref:Uncharacterized protein n=1 Tax=Entomomonas asaccharolytica TaxID=2785331 RepID=A0A974RVP0_9GAMM|nr:hypothetical protein [Entomomonas asaccharolytica]QQP84290.1 hypothetical protein JHT90_07565 [Entomomonas asaccharolytica]